MCALGIELRLLTLAVNTIASGIIVLAHLMNLIMIIVGVWVMDYWEHEHLASGYPTEENVSLFSNNYQFCSSVFLHRERWRA